jgi:hypothetical protein
MSDLFSRIYKVSHDTGFADLLAKINSLADTSVEEFDLRTESADFETATNDKTQAAVIYIGRFDVRHDTIIKPVGIVVTDAGSSTFLDIVAWSDWDNVEPSTSAMLLASVTLA